MLLVVVTHCTIGTHTFSVILAETRARVRTSVSLQKKKIASTVYSSSSFKSIRHVFICAEKSQPVAEDSLLKILQRLEDMQSQITSLKTNSSSSSSLPTPHQPRPRALESGEDAFSDVSSVHESTSISSRKRLRSPSPHEEVEEDPTYREKSGCCQSFATGLSSRRILWPTYQNFWFQEQGIKEKTSSSHGHVTFGSHSWALGFLWSQSFW